MTSTFKIATVNISGVGSEDRRKLLLNFCMNNKYDIVGLQEVSFTSCQILEEHYQLVANPGPKMNGTAILVRRDLPMTNIMLSSSGRITSARVNDFTFVTIYAPSGTLRKAERAEFFRCKIPEHVAGTKTPLILLGDFNAVDEINDRKKAENARRPVVVERSLIEMIAGLELVDLWKTMRTNEDGHTFIHRNGSARLDRIYCSRAVLKLFSGIRLTPNAITDHFTLETNLIVTVNLPRMKKEECIWKLNTSVLQEEAYMKMTEKFIKNATQLRCYQENIIEWWDNIFKAGIKKITQDYCRKRARRIRETKLFFQNCLKDLAPLVGNSEERWQEFQAIRLEARRWEIVGLQGARVRSRQNQAADTDDPSVFHIATEIKRARQSKIISLEIGEETTVTTSDAIDTALTTHFKTVFETANQGESELDDYFLSTIGKATISQSLVVPPLLIELSTALKGMGTNKSPGDDGIPYEFYNSFWKTLGPIFLKMFVKILEMGKLTQSQGNALIRLLPKSTSPKKIADFRPLSLLNCDYKLMAGVLATRMKKVLNQVIGPSQRGGIPGRRMSDNLELYRDVIEYTEERTTPPSTYMETIGPKVALIGVDLEKAYDLVDRKLLWKIMKTMGFPELFISWIETLYSVATMTVLNGSGVAGVVGCRRSLRQGCPLSIHLFVLYLEPLLTRLNRDLSGLELLGTRIVTRAYVDDLAVFISREEDFLKLEGLLRNFCRWSQARINQAKTSALGLGSWKDRPSWPIKWLKVTPTLKLLGIAFSTSIAETSARTWKTAHNELTGLLKNNYGRNFTLFQRTNFLKTAVLSKIVFIGQTLKCPGDVAKDLQTAMMTFLWSGKVLRPKAESTFRPVNCGGLGMINTQLFLKALFTRPILSGLTSQEDSPHRTLLRYWLSFPTRNYLPFYKTTPPPISYFTRPSYLSDIASDIKQLMENELMTIQGPKHHRIIYQNWLEEETVPGAIERDLPKLNWPVIWKGVSRLPHVIRETFFMFNHKLLYTRERGHRLDPNKDKNCLKCLNVVENETHIMAECPSRKTLYDWLHKKLKQMDCKGSLSLMVRGEFGKDVVHQKALSLVAAFVHLVWKERNQLRLPSIIEIEKLANIT